MIHEAYRGAVVAPLGAGAGQTGAGPVGVLRAACAWRLPWGLPCSGSGLAEPLGFLLAGSLCASGGSCVCHRPPTSPGCPVSSQSCLRLGPLLGCCLSQTEFHGSHHDSKGPRGWAHVANCSSKDHLQERRGSGVHLCFQQSRAFPHMSGVGTWATWFPPLFPRVQNEAPLMETLCIWAPEASLQTGGRAQLKPHHSLLRLLSERSADLPGCSGLPLPCVPRRERPADLVCPGPRGSSGCKTFSANIRAVPGKL